MCRLLTLASSELSLCVQEAPSVASEAMLWQPTLGGARGGLPWLRGATRACRMAYVRLLCVSSVALTGRIRVAVIRFSRSELTFCSLCTPYTHYKPGECGWRRGASNDARK